MNETIKNLLERRSVRGYKEDLVPEEVLNEILEAGEYAPSGMGQQGTLMVVTQNPELVAKLSKMNADVMGTESDPFYGAPTVVVVFADSNMPTCVENGSLVMGNLMNAAHALGVDSCWIHRCDHHICHRKICTLHRTCDQLYIAGFAKLHHLHGDLRSNDSDISGE